MATAPPNPDPFDDVRDAFKSLGTSEKAAFVLEATFETIGQALAETGRRAATVLDDLELDDWFRAPEPEDVGAPPPPPPAPPPHPAAPPPPRTRTTKKTTAKKASPKKTAGKPKPPPADDTDGAA